MDLQYFYSDEKVLTGVPRIDFTSYSRLNQKGSPCVDAVYKGKMAAKSDQRIWSELVCLSSSYWWLTDGDSPAEAMVGLVACLKNKNFNRA